MKAGSAKEIARLDTEGRAGLGRFSNSRTTRRKGACSLWVKLERKARIHYEKNKKNFGSFENANVPYVRYFLQKYFYTQGL